MKRLLALFLMFIAVFLFASCQANSPQSASVSSLNGVDISEFVIVYSEHEPDYNQHAAQYIRDRIQEYTGVSLSVKTDSSAAAAHEIIVGETSRPLSAALDEKTVGLEFAILADDTSIAMEGDYFIIAAAAYYFVATYIADTSTPKTIPQTPTVNIPIVEKPNNYIFLIGDGMGVYQTQIFEYLETPEGVVSDGEDSFYGYMLPYTVEARTKSNDSSVTDSAAAGTALATGYKTNNGYVGIDKDRNEIMSLTELAVSQGKATAVMSTEVLTGATPAAFSAHADSRSDEAAITASQEKLTETILETLNDSNDNDANESTIARVLSDLSNDKDGFFLMYEEAYIDKHCHSNDITATHKTMYRFNQAIGQFMEFAFYHPDTFVLITADHETGALQPDEQGQLKYNSTGHSSADVLVFSYGIGAEVFRGMSIENIQIPMTIAKFWGVNDFGDFSSGYAPLNEK